MMPQIKNNSVRYETWDYGWELHEDFALYPWQKATYTSRKKQPRFMDFSDAGVGKSLPMLCNIFNWIHNKVVVDQGSSRFRHGECGDVRNAVIYTPPSARIGWMLDAFTKFKTHSAELVEYSGDKARRKRLRKKVMQMNAEGTPVVLLVSWGLMSANTAEDRAWINKRFNPFYVIADEAQYISGTSSSRYERFMNSIMFPKLESDYKFVHFITATPFSNHMNQAWPYLCLCYASPVTGRNTAYPGGHQEYISDHFDMIDDSRDPSGYLLVNFRDEENKIEGLVRRKGIVHKRENVFKDRKEPFISVKTFSMDPDQEAMYWYFVNNLYFKDEEGNELEAVNTNVRMMRERQLASNPAILGFESSKNKFNLLVETLEEYGIKPKCSENGKVLILTEFRHTWTDLKEKLENLGYKTTGIRGGDSMKSRKAAISLFNSDKEANIFLGSRKSMAEGTNLQKAHIHVDYELGWETDRFIQGRGRVDRSGQENRISYVAFTAEDTIDYLVYNKVMKKLVFFHDLLSGTAEKTKGLVNVKSVMDTVKKVMKPKRRKLDSETIEKLKASLEIK